ncbi:MAG: ComF family protein [Candidatus Omnitrophota bacterium]|nr:ComF family protein [Candidatus Omnitrophota bacterium]
MFKGLIKGFLDLLYPAICLACRKRLPQEQQKQILCSGCRDKIKFNLPPFCFHCGRNLGKKGINNKICRLCSKKKLNFDRAFAPCIYEGVIKELIHQFKYSGKKHLAEYLCGIIVNFVNEYELPINTVDFIIPIPLSATRRREREFNQAEILGNYIGARFSKTVVKDILVRNRHTRSQTELDDLKRFTNIKGCFTLKNSEIAKGKNILIIDDVLTTGATLSEAALLLKSQGQAKQVLVLTLAN